MKNIEFLVGAYTFIWLILAYYFYFTGSKLKELEKKVRILEEEKSRE